MASSKEQKAEDLYSQHAKPTLIVNAFFHTNPLPASPISEDQVELLLNIQDRFLSCVLDTAWNKKYQPSKEHRARTLRAFQRELDTVYGSSRWVMSDSFVEAVSEIMMMSSSQEESSWFSSFRLVNGGGRMACRVGPQYKDVGQSVWPSALLLLHTLTKDTFIENECAPLRCDKLRVLELGSGVGLSALLLSHPWWSNHVESLRLTDYTDVVTENIQTNIATVQGVEHPDALVVSKLDWMDPAHREQIQTVWKPHIVIAADVVYDHDVIGGLSETLRMCMMSNESVVCYVFQTLRNPVTIDMFLKSVEGFCNVEVVDVLKQEAEENPEMKSLGDDTILCGAFTITMSTLTRLMI
eukprot:PhF_6_TR23980/c0_g1_i1/m.33579